MGGRTGLKVDEQARNAWLAMGPQTTVTLALDRTVPVRVVGGADLVLDSFALTADDPHGFVAAATAHATA